MNNRTLFNTLRNIRRLSPVVITLILVATILVAGQPASASGAVSVQGTFRERVYRGTNCPSPIHICGSGPLNGDINGKLTGILTTEDDVYQNGQLVTIIFTGHATIVTGCGTLSDSFNVVEQIPSFTSVSTLNITGGTGDCANTTGVLTFTATPASNPPSGNMEVGTYTGTLVNFPQ